MAKAADCKSAIVGSTPTGASYQKTPLFPQYSKGNAGFFRLNPGDGLRSLMAPFRTSHALNRILIAVEFTVGLLCLPTIQRRCLWTLGISESSFVTCFRVAEIFCEFFMRIFFDDAQCPFDLAP